MRIPFAVFLVFTFVLFVVLLMRTMLTAMMVRSFHHVFLHAKSEWLYQRLHFMIESSAMFKYRLDPEDLVNYKHRLVSTEDLGMEDETHELADIKTSIDEIRRILSQVDSLSHHHFHNKMAN